MLKGFKTQLFFVLFLIVITSQLNAGWIEIKILHTGKTYINNNTIDLNIKTRELIAVKFITHYTNDSVTEDYNCWLRDGYYGSQWFKYQFPEYAEKWEDKTINLSPQESTTLENTVYIHPSHSSTDTVMIWYGEKTENKRITNRWQKLIINVSSADVAHPDIEAEPQFTSGTSNTVTWLPVRGSSVQDVYFFDDADPSDLRKAAQRLYKHSSSDSPRTAVFENLQNGHKYGYFARSEIITETDTLYMCSDFTYSIQDNTPPERVVTIHAEYRQDKIDITWQGVKDDISTVEKYIIFRKTSDQNEMPLDTVYADGFEDDIFNWSDMSFNKGKSIFYRVRAVDEVGNVGEGVRSNTIFVSGEEDNQEDSEDNEENNDSDSKESNPLYIQGSVDTLWIELSVEDTVQALLFESVRDSMVYFNSKPSLPMRYFNSGWVDPEILRKRGWVSENNPDKVFFVFDYTDTENAFVGKNGLFNDNIESEHINPNFVNGKTYLRRVISKYEITQDTVWLERKIPDCYPPNDIRNLSAEVRVEETLFLQSEWEVILHWEPAYDAVSGVKRYHVYRKIDNVNDDFIKQGIVSSPEFIDTLSVFSDISILNPLILYKVSAEDSVGNIREIDESDWVARERSLQGPEVAFTDTGSDMDYLLSKDTLITQKDKVLIDINKFDISDVLKYEVDVNGSLEIFKNVDRSKDILDILLPQNEISTLKVRAVYLGNRVSMWSNTLIVIRNFNKRPENFKAVNDSLSWEGNIKLSWTRTSLDIEKYEIFREGGKIGETWTRDETVTWTDYYGVDEKISKPGDTLTAYKNYTYTVRAVNVFREKSKTAPEEIAYCNHAPEIVIDEKKNQNNNFIIRIGWIRTFPSYLEPGKGIKYEVKIYQDSLTNFLRKSAIVYSVNADTMYEDYEVPSGHNYIFRIRGVPNSYPDRPSGWSKPYTIPDFSLFADLESLALPGRDIFINWNNAEYIKKFKINSFTITRSVTNTQEKTWFFPSNTLSFVDSSNSLKHGEEYIYTIQAIDSLDQILDEKSVSAVCDSVAFIPDIDATKTPVYFKQTSLKVCWKWINDITNEDITEGTEGADSLAIQLSIDKNFPSIADQTVITEYFKADTHRCRLVQIPKLTSRRNEEVFIRITAKDKWGHNDMSSGDVWWSSDFYPVRISVYDTVPSPAVTESKVEYKGAYNLASDSIIVNCEWSGENVEEGTIDPDRTIMWNAEFYRIVRKLDNQEWVQDAIPVQKALDSYMYSGSAPNRDFQWRVDVIDSAGNVTQGEYVNADNFLQTPEPPVPISYKSCIISEIDTVNSKEYLVEIALDRSHFSIAYQNEDIKERLLCQIGWTINDTCTCISGWGSIQVDTTWFRLKVREKRGDNLVESAWSQLAPFSGSSVNDKNVTHIDNNNDNIKTFKIYPNKPNPFNNTTNIRYELPELSDVTISIYNMKGALIKKYSRNRMYPGSYSFIWDGTDTYQKYVSSGIYICFIRVDTESGNVWNNEIKMLLIK